MVGLFMCLINPFVGALNEALYGTLQTLGPESRVALGALLAAMMAIDMGGPFNKAAYLFGTSTLAALASGQRSDVMAAVMSGGMVPPLSIALATTFFKSRFTQEECKSGTVNYILGLCFITEGAVPFAAEIRCGCCRPALWDLPCLAGYPCCLAVLFRHPTEEFSCAR